MLGLADRSRVFDLYGAVMAGKIADALGLLEEQYALGADPEVVLRDLLEITHWLTRVKLAPQAAEDPAVPELERERGRDMATGLAMPHLTRAWQMLLKGLEECKAAPSPIQAAEMVLIRLAYASDLPSPADLVKQIKSGQDADADRGERPCSLSLQLLLILCSANIRFRPAHGGGERGRDHCRRPAADNTSAAKSAKSDRCGSAF